MAPLIKLADEDPDDRVWLVAGMARRHVPGPRIVTELIDKGLAKPVQVVSPEVLALYTEV